MFVSGTRRMSQSGILRRSDTVESSILSDDTVEYIKADVEYVVFLSHDCLNVHHTLNRRHPSLFETEYGTLIPERAHRPKESGSRSCAALQYDDDDFAASKMKLSKCCPEVCASKFSIEDVVEFRQTFWAKDQAKQWQYISSVIETCSDWAVDENEPIVLIHLQSLFL